MSKAALNEHRFREPWLHAALGELRPLFSKVGLEIPEKIRCAFGLSSSGSKSPRKSECWPPEASADQHCEIFISPDIADPVEVLGHFCHALVHACLPAGVGHGPEFRTAANRIGLEGKMRHALPGPMLLDKLHPIAASLGPLPHARLDLTARILDRGALPADRPKKQKARQFKVECPHCEGENKPFILRMARRTAKEIGLPLCPKHGAVMVMDAKADDMAEDVEAAEAAPSPTLPPDAPIILPAPPAASPPEAAPSPVPPAIIPPSPPAQPPAGGV